MLRKIRVITQKWWAKALFLAMGIGSLVWFLVRVIPKPSRAAYPCMRVALPMASSLVVYLIGLTSFTMLMRKARDRFRKAKYTVSALLAVAGILVGTVSIVSYQVKLKANPLTEFKMPNEVFGAGVGIFPGRVVWEHNPNATDQTCSNSYGDYWHENTDQAVVDQMLSAGLQHMTGAANDADAWDAIFKYYNNNHSKGDVGYAAGEKIVIKTNNNGPSYKGESVINTSPQLTYALLDQLINTAGVAQSNITIGDPNCETPDYTYDLCHGAFPNVKYYRRGLNPTKVDDVLILSDGTVSDPLPASYLAAEYLINVPVLKKHHRAGISIAAKNHFGSVAPFTEGAWHLHYSLPCPDATGVAVNGDYGAYRCFVDIMGHKDLGGKTLFYLVDGLWSSVNWGHPPVKWRMEPFNNDWPSSLFLSQDPVAIESVCFDFLYEEFDEDHPTEGGTATDDKGPFPHFAGTDDYLRQAADPAERPFDYDPEDDGSVLGSLGVHEHWNNATDKQYSRNLGLSEGIELYLGPDVSSRDMLADFDAGQLSNYPNPFTEQTTIRYTLYDAGMATLDIYNIQGQKVHSVTQEHGAAGEYEYVWNASGSRGDVLPAGQYILRVSTDKGGRELVRKAMIVR